MPKIVPFRAVRPTRDKVSLIASRAYESYTEEQRKARLDTNPYSFLHVLNPGYKYHKVISGHRHFELVKNRYEEFKDNGYFIKDSQPAYYFHKIVNRENQVFHGIVGAASIEDYQHNIIKKHEETLSKRVETFKNYLEIARFSAEPVLVTYKDNARLKEIFNTISKTRAEYEFTTTYRDTHYLWVVDDQEVVQEVTQQFSQMDSAYIADGHHRSKASALLADHYAQKEEQAASSEALRYFMTFNIPESELSIYEFNRLVRDLNGLSKEEFLVELDTYFHIENRGNTFYRPEKKGFFSMYLDGAFYSLHLRKYNYTFTDSLSKLDVRILYDTILNPILGIKDLRHDKRISYAHGKKGMAYIKGLIDKGEYAIGFGLLPTTIEEVKEIADDGLVMPPKATYIEPKLRSAVTIYEI